MAEAGDSLGWAEVAATGRDPLTVVRADVKKMLRSGTKSLKRTVEAELEAKSEEAGRIETVVEKLQDLADAGESAFPTEFTFERTAKSGTTKFKVTTEVVTVADPDEAAKAARKLEKSLPRWGRIRDAAVEDLKARQETLALVGRNLSDVLDGWRSLMKEVLIVMH